MTSYEHVNDLFGKNFQLNFGDSEQTIRMFIGKISSNIKFDLKITEEGPLSKLPKFNEKCKNIRLLHKKLNETDDQIVKNQIVKELKDLEEIVIPQTNEWVSKYLASRLEIASYYDMCANCHATFEYDFKVKNHIARTILKYIF
jgi:hypothetical protein